MPVQVTPKGPWYRGYPGKLVTGSSAKPWSWTCGLGLLKLNRMKTQQHSLIDIRKNGPKNFYSAIAFLLLLAGLRCVDTQSAGTNHSYYFEVDGKHYQITASRPASGRDDNILIQVDGNQILAMDTGCTGEVDSVARGAMTVEDANIIYAIGLAINHSTNPEGRIYRRMYRTADEIQTYTFQTVISRNGRIYNRLIIIDESPPENTVVLDTDADGILDRMSRGNYQPENYQEYYSMVLAHGLRDSEIEKKYNMYFVATELDY